MKFFDPGEPSHTLSQCWPLPRAFVSGEPDSDLRSEEPARELRPAGRRRSDLATASGNGSASSEDDGNP